MLGLYCVCIYTAVVFVLVMFVCQLKKINKEKWQCACEALLPEILHWGDQILQVDYLVPAFKGN